MHCQSWSTLRFHVCVCMCMSIQRNSTSFIKMRSTSRSTQKAKQYSHVNQINMNNKMKRCTPRCQLLQLQEHQSPSLPRFQSLKISEKFVVPSINLIHNCRQYVVESTFFLHFSNRSLSVENILLHSFQSVLSVILRNFPGLRAPF